MKPRTEKITSWSNIIQRLVLGVTFLIIIYLQGYPQRLRLNSYDDIKSY